MSIVLYSTEEGKAQFALQEFDEQLWMTQADIAELYQTSKQNISKHIKAIVAEGELSESATVNYQLTVQNEGGRKVNRKIAYYSLPMIIAVGYRVRSTRGTQFHQWATERLSEYLVKGFSLDDGRLKGTGGGDYWKELLNRIRDIRSSEKALYRQVLDLYATSQDYNGSSPESKAFFATVQNKLHYAASEQTAPELIYRRADSGKDFMGLTTFAGAMPTLNEAKIAKNYLTEDELFRLNRLVYAFFDTQSPRAKPHVYARLDCRAGQIFRQLRQRRIAGRRQHQLQTGRTESRVRIPRIRSPHPFARRRKLSGKHQSIGKNRIAAKQAQIEQTKRPSEHAKHRFQAA